MENLGRYALGALLGEGGSSRVYRSHLRGPGFSRPVALKVLTGGGQLLEREARLGGLLRHPNLVDVYEVGRDQDVWYCALEYCAGGTLDAWIPLSPRAVVDVGLQVCAALAYAHEALGLVHLDLKPRNLFVSEGRVKVGDLGISVAEGFELPGRHGTPGYMAPELFGDGPVDVRADVYGLGMTLFHLATGLVPVPIAAPASASPERELEATHRVLEPVAAGAKPALLRPEAVSLTSLPAWLAPVVRRCVEPDPEDRWPDMQSLADALRGLACTGPSLSQVVGWEPPVGSPVRAGALGDEPDAFVGREPELAALAEGLQSPGVLTLKGPPGVGKSRLGATATRQWSAAEGPAWLCPLVEVRTLEGLLVAVGRALGVPLSSGGQSAHQERLGQSLAQRGPCVLLLDNFEHIVGLASVVGMWRDLAPDARFLVTSRVPLGVEGERVIEVPPMTEADAVALLVARARQRGVQMGASPALTRLAQRLDGLPLALELAAGRLGVLSVQDILARLDLSLLRSGAEDRHATLRGALEWSWGLLSEREQAALAQLSVFAGGATLPAAEEVLDIDGSVLDVVSSLVERSLLRVSEGRLRLYESVRAWASEKLVDARPIERRHAAWFARWGSDAGLQALGQQGGIALQQERLRDRENLWAGVCRAAAWREGEWASQLLFVGWAVCFRDGPYEGVSALVEQVQGFDSLSAELQARITVLRAHLLRRMGRLDEARAQLDHALSVWGTLDRPRHEAEAHKLLGDLLRHQGQGREAARAYATALDAFRAGRCRRGEAGVRAVMGDLCRIQGRLDEATDHYVDALSGFQEVGDRQSEAIPRGGLGLICSARQQHEAAAGHFEVAQAILREAGSVRNEALIANNIGLVRHAQGQLDAARGHFETALRLSQEIRDLFCAAIALGNLGRVHAFEGRFQDAEASFEAALETYRDFDHPHGACNILVNLGLLARRRGDKDGAQAWLLDALQVARDGGFRMVEGYALTELGDLGRARGELDGAAAHLEDALALYGGTHAPGERARALWCQGALHRQCGRVDEARRAYDAALEVARSAQSPELVGIVLAHIARLIGEAGDLEGARARLDASRKQLGGPSDALVEHHLIEAALCWRFGETSAARVALEKARSVGTPAAELRDAIAELSARLDTPSDSTEVRPGPPSDP